MNEFITNEAKSLAAQQEKAMQNGTPQNGAVQPGNQASAQSGASGSQPKSDQDTPGLLREAVQASDDLALNRAKAQLQLQQESLKAQGLQLQNAKLTQQMQMTAMEGEGQQ